jgi:hypothetical protein
MIQKDIRDVRLNLSKYLIDYKGQKIYISKYNKIIGEIKFYSDKEKELVRLDIAKEIINNPETEIELI